MKPWFRKIPIVLALAVGCYAVAHLAFSWWAGRRLQQAVAVASAVGLPMDAGAIVPPRVPEVENAARLYIEAYQRMKTARVGERELVDYIADQYDLLLTNNAATHPPAEAIDAVLRRNDLAAVLQLIDTGASRLYCRFDTDYAAGPKMRMDYLLPLRALTRLAAVRAMTAAARDTPDAAWRDAVTGLRLCQALQHDPTIIGQLVRTAQVENMAAAMERMAQVAPLGPGRLEELRVILSEMDSRDPFVNCFNGERLLFAEWVFDLPVWRIWRNIDWFNVKPDFRFRVFPEPVLKYNHAAYLNTMRQATLAMAQPARARESELMEPVMDALPELAFLAKAALPTADRVIQRADVCIAQVRLAQVGLALAAYRDMQGAYPETLDPIAPSLTPGADTDPFSGESFIYRGAGDTAVVYSIGVNRIDDGGTRGSNGSQRDIVWELGSR